MSVSIKERHYWSQLRAALTAGHWRSSIPAKAQNGAALPWKELLRKFNKHCKGYKHLADIASYTQLLAHLLSTEVEDEDVVGNSVEPPLDIGMECSLEMDGYEEALATYEVLKGMETNNSNSLNFLLAYYAYALNKPQDCIEHVSRVQDILLIQNHIPSISRSANPSLLVPGSRGETSVASIAASFTTATIIDTTVPEIRDGRGWAMAETFRSICLQGMSSEKLYPTEPHRALQIYTTTLPLFSILTSEFTISSNSTFQTTGKLDFTPFLQLREVWRWVERLIWRAVVLSSQICDVHFDDDDDSSNSNSNTNTSHTVSLWKWLHHYMTFSTSWPSTFRTAHRSTISTIYLRAFILRYRILSSSPSLIPTIITQTKTHTKTTSQSTSHSQSQSLSLSSKLKNRNQETPTWFQQSRSLIQDYQAILSYCTTFPKAGERNVRVEEFVDLCVGIWECYGCVGEVVGWVIDILWWATRLTFNSPRIYRHMTRLFQLSDQLNLSKKSLKLYVQIVGKAFEACGGNNVGKGNGIGGNGIGGEGGLIEDIDEDKNWVEMLIWGVRMICKDVVDINGSLVSSYSSLGNGNFTKGSGVGASTRGAGGGGGGGGEVEILDDLKYAETLFEKARLRLDWNDKLLVASLLLAEGIWNSVMALREEDPYTRPTRLTKSHELLIQSINIWPTSSAYYHLALSFSRPSFSPFIASSRCFVPSPMSGFSGGSENDGNGNGNRFWGSMHGLEGEGERFENENQSEGGERGREKERKRDITKAIECAALALEGDPKEIRYWHLLGLLLSCQEKWKDAKEVLERGAELDLEVFGDDDGGEEDEEGESESENDNEEVQGQGQGQGQKVVKMEEDEDDEGTVLIVVVNQNENGDGDDVPTPTLTPKPKPKPKPKSQPTIINGTSTSTGAGTGICLAYPSPAYVLPPSTPSSLPISSTQNQNQTQTQPRTIPPASKSGLLRSILEKTPPSRREIYEYGLQLRMTLTALVEVLEGPEGAEEKWVEVFAWIADRNRKEKEREVGSSDHSHSVRISLESSGPGAVLNNLGAHANVNAKSIGVEKETLGGAQNQNQSRVNEKEGEKEKKKEKEKGKEKEKVDVENIQEKVQIEQDQISQQGHTQSLSQTQTILTPVPITISPATPDIDTFPHHQIRSGSPVTVPSISSLEQRSIGIGSEVGSIREDGRVNGVGSGSTGGGKRSSSIDRDTSKSKKVQQMLKDRVHKGRAGISAVSRKMKIGHGVVKHHRSGLRRTNSSPADFHDVIRKATYQASSIHSRRHFNNDRALNDSSPPLPPPPPPPPPPSLPSQQEMKMNARQARENKLLSDLWLMSAATFRRLGKIEQTKGAIQEAEVRDEGNPAVWVQLGLYYLAEGQTQHAIDAFQKALFIDTDDVAATIHLSRLYLTPSSTTTSNNTTSSSHPQSSSPTSHEQENDINININIETTSTSSSNNIPPTIITSSTSYHHHHNDPSTNTNTKFSQKRKPEPELQNVDLAAGLLTHLTKGRGWDVPEAWFFLGKAFGLQGRKDKEREALGRALELIEGRGVREVGAAVGWCI